MRQPRTHKIETDHNVNVKAQSLSAAPIRTRRINVNGKECIVAMFSSLPSDFVECEGNKDFPPAEIGHWNQPRIEGVAMALTS